MDWSSKILADPLRLARSGTWVNEERLTWYPILMLTFYLLACLAVVFTRTGLLDWRGEPIGTDFSMMWSTGQLVLEGRPASAYSLTELGAMERKLFGLSTPFYGWHYPPYFLAFAALVAYFPYFVALAAWQGATLSLFLFTIRRMLPWPVSGTKVLFVALAFPANFVNLGHGQNGFLTASLLGLSILALPARPALAGCLFALLAYKPQFALAIPVALLAGSHWRAIVAGVVMWIIITLGTILLFGSSTWMAFFESLSFTRLIVIEQGATGWEKIQSVFAGIRLLGGSVQAAYLLQSAATLLVLGALAAVWKSGTDCRLKGAALIAATLLTTPYCLDYDMMVLGPAIALLVSYGLSRDFSPYEVTFLTVVWTAPILVRGFAAATSIPLGPVLTISFFGWICARAHSSHSSVRCSQLIPYTGSANDNVGVR